MPINAECRIVVLTGYAAIATAVDAILTALNGNTSSVFCTKTAARLLKMHRRTLQRKLAKRPVRS